MPTNRVLTDKDRAAYQVEIDLMRQYCPDMLNRKIGSAVVQQAFVLHTALYDFAAIFQGQHKRMPTFLSAGSYEDTAGEVLKALGFSVIDIDPVLNSDLHTYVLQNGAKVDAVISTSVLEHVENDEEFIADAARLLLPNGIGIFTCDFKNDWDGGRAPATSRRFYTTNDLVYRLRAVLRANNCDLIDEPDYSEVDTFSWEGIPYSFATFVFRKGT